ncbi:hypothetical protein [Streptomyces sp. NPDC047315]|uniref:hypothetical protein n=1 Tax=Streptomyces sp. NPDC047315 TaxID=3155142 RepID=UPI0033DB3ADF
MTVMTLNAALGPVAAEKNLASRALPYVLRHHADKALRSVYLELCEDLERVLAPNAELDSEQVEALTDRFHRVDRMLLCAASHTVVHEVGTLLLLRSQRPRPEEPLTRRLGHLRRLALAVLGVLDGTPPPPDTCVVPEAGGEQPHHEYEVPQENRPERAPRHDDRVHGHCLRLRAGRPRGDEPPRSDPVPLQRAQPPDVIELLLL